MDPENPDATAPTDPDLQEHVVDAFRIAPTEAISITTIRDTLDRDGRQVSKAVVRAACDELVAAGVLECVTAMGAYTRRYRLVEGEPA